MNTAIVKRLILGAVLASFGTLCAAGECTVRAQRPAGVPEAADAWVVVPSVGQTVNRLRKVADAVAPGTGQILDMTLRGQLTAAGLNCLDEYKPLTAVFSLGQKPGVAAAGQIREGLDPLKAIEEKMGKAAREEDGVTTFLSVQDGNLPDKEIYVVLKDGRLTLGDDLKLVQALAAAPAPGGFADETDVLGGVDLKRLAEVRKQDIAELIEKLEAGPAEPPPMPGLQPAMVKAIGGASAALLRDALANAETFCAELRFGETEVSCAWVLKAVAGGTLASSVEKLAAARPVPFKAPAGKAVISLSADIAPEVSAKIKEMGHPFFKALFQAEQDGAKAARFDEMLKAIDRILAAADGKVGEVVIGRADGVCGIYRAGLKDGKAAREATIATFTAMTSPELTGGLEAMGFKYTLTEKARKSGALDVDRLAVEFTAAAGPGQMMMEAVYGNPMLQEMAFAEKALFGAFGKDADKALDELLAVGGGAAGELPVKEHLADTLKRAPAGSFVVGELSLIEYVRMLTGTMQAAGAPFPAPELGEDPGEPVTFWMTAGEGQLGGTANIPVAPVRRIFQAWQAAMQQMMQNPPPPRPLPPMPPPDGVEEF